MIEVFANLFVFQALNADSNTFMHTQKTQRAVVFSLVFVGLFLA